MAIEFLNGIDLAGDLELKKTDPKIILFDDSGANGTPNGEIVFAEVDDYENFKLRYNGLNDRFEYWGLISNTSTLVGYWNRSTDTSLHSVGSISTGSDGTSANWKTAYDHSQAAHAPTDAEANVQADWTETTTTSDAFILNKPTIPTDHGDHDGLYLPIGGGSLTGDLLPNADSSYDIGSNASKWAEGHFDHLYVGETANNPRIDIYTENGTASLADTFEDTSTDKSYIYFNAGTNSNDPGFIMHETSESSSPDERNEGVLHLVPSDDNGYGDYVSIHGTNDADAIKLHTNGRIETAANIQLDFLSGSGSVKISDSLDVTGSITVAGTVDGVDISSLPTSFAPTDAEANVQADWTATSGDALILNKPTIPSGNSIIDWTADQGSTNIHVNNVVGYINSSEPNEPFNPFAGQKFHDGVLTNALAGRHDRFVVTIDGTVEAGASLKLSNQNFEEYNQNRLFGTSAGETKVFNINVQSLATGSPNSSGITYSAGFFDINFYSSPFPASWSARVKNKNGAWNPVTSLTKIGSSKLRGVIPISNYLTDIEFTLVARTSSPFVTGNITYGISEFELFFSRMSASQGGNISSIGGYLGGVITTASGTTSTNWNSAYGWGDHSLAGYSTATGVANNAEVNVQADWNETSNTSDAFILNKPTVTASGQLHRQTGEHNSLSIGPGWITVAKNQGGRKHGEVIVSDSDSSDHAFIRIDWMRSYADSNFSVLNVGGHSNRIRGVRVLSQDSDNTYGWKYLQVYVTTASIYGVRVHTVGTPRGYSSHTSMTPILENTKSGYIIHGNALTDLHNSSLAAEEGLTVGGDIAVGGTVDGVDISALPTSFAPTDAEANVQADWNATSGDALILNKPTIPSVPDSYAPTDAEANVQADWDETTTTSDAFILNKPTIPTSFNNLNAVDDRDIAPEDLTYNDDFRIYFADKGQIEGGSNTSDYQDLLVLNSYTDATGGDANALAFDKNNFRILHYQADQADTNWGTAKQIAYTDEIPTDHGDHDGLYVPVGGGTITSGTSVGLTINHNTFEQGLVLHRNHASNAASIVFKNNGGVNGTFFAAAADGAPYWQYNDTASPNYRIHTTNDFTVATVTGALPKAGGTMTGTLVMSAVNPEIHFNGTSDTGVDMAIKATPEGLDFYEPEDTNKIHFQILDDAGVNAVYGYKVNGTDVISSTKVLANVTGNISMFTNDSGYLTRTTPVAPSSLTTTIVNSTINVGFTASTTTNIDYYLVFSSVSGGDYGLISVIPPADFGATMSIIDNTFDATGTQAYRVYAVKNGVYSAALTGSEDYAVTSAEPTNMSVVNLNTAYYVQWDPPSANARFITAYNVYKHEHATQGSLDRNSATLIYSGLNTSYMYQISGSNNINYHQFWVETTIG
jgi:hypothetical protein